MWRMSPLYTVVPSSPIQMMPVPLREKNLDSPTMVPDTYKGTLTSHTHILLARNRRVSGACAQPPVADSGADTGAGAGRLDAAAAAELDLWDSRFMLRGDRDPEAGGARDGGGWGPRGWCKPSCIPISIILVLIVLVVLLPLLDGPGDTGPAGAPAAGDPALSAAALCGSTCRASLVESIPEGLRYPPGATPHPSTHAVWLDLVAAAEYSIEIASFYWTLQQGEVYPDPSSKQGEQVFEALLEAGTKRNISLLIAQNRPRPSEPNVDTEYLARKGAAQVRSVDFDRLMGGGVLHTKLWLIDRMHVYVGSANMDWRSLTQVKELGVVVYNCSCLATDMGKIFDVYWTLGQPDSQIPGVWPDTLTTQYNIQNPLNASFNDTNYAAYIASSPPSFCPDGRATDLAAILNVIQTADEFIYISVMDYIPMTIYTKEKQLWPDIDDALRAAAVNRKVHVRLLISLWNHTRPAIPHFLRSLQALNGVFPKVHVEVKMFVVPSSPEQQKIPFARVNHNKYMVTDKTAYIGTSNWSGDYFITTGGVGLVLSEAAPSTKSGIRAQLQAVFERDWGSPYAQPLQQQC